MSPLGHHAETEVNIPSPMPLRQESVTAGENGVPRLDVICSNVQLLTPSVRPEREPSSNLVPEQCADPRPTFVSRPRYRRSFLRK